MCFNLRYYAQNQNAAALVAAGAIGEPRFVTGRYHQDWLLLDTDWNWRLDAARQGGLRAVADIGSHWLDLDPLRHRPPHRRGARRPAHVRRPSATTRSATSSRSAAGVADDVERVREHMESDDAAGLLLRFDDGQRGACTISQVSAGRKNTIEWEVDGSTAALAWASEDPERLWIGHRDRPNEVVEKDPAVMTPAGAAAAAYPAGHVEGYPDTFRALFADIYRDVAAGGRRRARPTRRSPTATTPCSWARRSAPRPAPARGPRSNGPDERPTKETTMKLGLLTAAFPDTPLTEVADWAAANGFAMLEVACWPRADGPTRRYAGVSHIDCADLSDDQAKELVGDLAERGIEISGLGYYPNPLHPDLDHRAEVIAHLGHVIDGRRQARRARRQHVHRQRQGPAADGELRGVHQGVAGHRRPGRRPRRQDRASRTAR